MSKSQSRVLIIDDDSSFGKACLESLKRDGWDAFWAKSVDEARSLIKRQSFQVIVIDCMLPQKSGIELAQEIRSSDSSDISFFLMSGIYKDKAFIREALQKTSAIDFFVKPFSMQSLIDKLHSLSTFEEHEDKDPIPLLFASPNLKPRKIVSAIEESDHIHGFELPFIYSLFLTSGVSGQMNIVEAEGLVFGVTFSKGKIIAVETDDPPSFVGEILIEKNLLPKEEIEKEMAKESEHKIGQRLVQANLLSPHILNEILIEQMEIRLTNTILDSSVEVNFTKVNDLSSHFGIEMHNFAFLLARWFQNKVTKSWLKNYYLHWLDHQVIKGVRYSESHPIFETTPFIYMSEFSDDLLEAKTLHSLLETQKYSEDDVFLRTHLLTITRCFSFGAGAKKQDNSQHLQRLQKIYNEIQNKDHFEVLNVSKNAQISEVKRAFNELSQVINLQGLQENTPEELKVLSQKLSHMIKIAFETLSNEDKKQTYLKEIRQMGAQKLLIADSLIEQGQKLLSTGQAKMALQKFTEAFEIDKTNPDILAYLAWAKLKLLKSNQSNIEEMRQIERDIGELTQQSQQSSLVYFVKGLFQKEKGNVPLAKNHFESAINLDNNFLEARRELNVLKLEQKKEKSVDILHGDIKDVVGMLFRRK